MFSVSPLARPSSRGAAAPVRYRHQGPQEPAMRPQTDRQRLIRRALRLFAPKAPYADTAEAYERARAKRMRDLAPHDAAFLALVAHVRHEHTDYDALLAEGYDRDSARHFVLDDTNDVLTSWGGTRFVDGSEREDARGAIDATDTDGDDPDG